MDIFIPQRSPAHRKGPGSEKRDEQFIQHLITPNLMKLLEAATRDLYQKPYGVWIKIGIYSSA
jgi:hypothetical protein